ncbi:hypothetical protein [Streptomyces roseolus]|uniref:hypothetical protein n=1 Tax=Streptomyces roseolus TaxID=67358 RepID=UPI0037BC8E7F
MSYCPAPAAVLTPEDKKLLNELPGAAFDMEAEDSLECSLQGPHDGDHVGLAQSQDHTPDQQTHWWLRWNDAGDRRWTHEPLCPAERDEQFCSLPDRHPLGHNWV